MNDIALVGYTGFVGSNIYASAGNAVSGLYNSKNIKDSYATEPDMLIYSGLRAEKYLANNAPDKDMALIRDAMHNIEMIRPRNVVLISTIDVFKDPAGRDEGSDIDTEDLHPYGYNRYQLEKWVRENYPDALIIRLPGLYGINLKKNFIYDYINVIPFMLREDKLHSLMNDPGNTDGTDLTDYYELQDNGFYKLKGDVSEDDKAKLRAFCRQIGFSALNFTDSRSVYQFYDLKRLWNDMGMALRKGIRVFHPATEPVSASEIYKYLCGEEFSNEISDKPAYYDYHTRYAALFGSKGDYIETKAEVLENIRAFVTASRPS